MRSTLTTGPKFRDHLFHGTFERIKITFDFLPSWVHAYPFMFLDFSGKDRLNTHRGSRSMHGTICYLPNFVGVTFE